MVVTCDIEFKNNPEGVYYAGQVIMGNVTLTADKMKQVKAVSLKLNGSAQTRWKERRKSYWGQVDYINTVTCLLVPKNSDEAVVIEPGIHTFSFACHLPLNCPSSVEGDHGSIRYVIQVSLECPWKVDQTFSKIFTVLSVMDLNYGSPVLKLPVQTDMAKSCCCGPFRSDFLEINVNLPQSGYVPGQLIPINILVTNNTMLNINEICARLVMIIEYCSTNLKNSTSQKKTVSKLMGDPVFRSCKKNFNYLLPIPATPPSCLTECSIIHITYRLEVEAKIQGIFYFHPCIQTPVTIGNVPLRMESMVVLDQPAAERLHSERSMSMSNDNNEPWTALGNIPCATYMEASHMSMTKQEFTPKYSVFDVQSSTSRFFTNGDEVDGQSSPSIATDPDKTTWL